MAKLEGRFLTACKSSTLLLTVWLLATGQKTAGLLASVTALVLILTLLLRPKKDDADDAAT